MWNKVVEKTVDAKANIGKLYLDPIHLADPGSTRSTPIHSGVLLIHLQVPQLALPLIRSNQEPVF